MRKNTIVLLGLSMIFSSMASSACSLAELSFVEDGVDWVSEHSGKRTVESWKWVSESTIEGEGVTLDIATLEYDFVESLRLVEMLGEVFYLAKVRHNALPTAFKLVSCEKVEDSQTFVFENPGHDFPKRISYQHAGDELHVLVSDDKGKGFTTSFKADK